MLTYLKANDAAWKNMLYKAPDVPPINCSAIVLICVSNISGYFKFNSLICKSVNICAAPLAIVDPVNKNVILYILHSLR